MKKLALLFIIISTAANAQCWQIVSASNSFTIAKKRTIRYGRGEEMRPAGLGTAQQPIKIIP